MQRVEISPSADTVLDQVRAVIVASLALDLPPSAIGPTDVLFEGGTDSVRAIELLAALEDAFGVRFSDDELDPSVLRSAETLAALVRAALAREGKSA